MTTRKADPLPIICRDTIAYIGVYTQVLRGGKHLSARRAVDHLVDFLVGTLRIEVGGGAKALIDSDVLWGDDFVKEIFPFN